MQREGYFGRFGIFRPLKNLLGRLKLRHTDAFYLNLLAVCIGIAVALFVWMFKGGVNYLSTLIRGHGEGQQLALFHDHPWVILLVPPLGGLLVGLIFRFWGRHRRFRGVSGVIESVARRGGRLSLRKGFVELLNSMLTIASGMSVGMEGPIVVAGGTIGSNISDIFKLSAARRRALLACGAAAGISAVFNAPIAGFFFALELILGDFRKKAVAPIVLASVAANVTIQALTGGEQVFELAELGGIHLVEIGNFALLGIICGLVAYLFAQFLLFCDTFFPHLRLYPPLKPMIGGAIVSLTALFFPEILGTSHHATASILLGEFSQANAVLPQLVWGSSIAYLLALAAAKIFATSVTLGSGAAGGKFAPSLFIGSSVGMAFGTMLGAQQIIPVGDPRSYSLVGMATIFGAIGQAPLTVILLVFEMTGNYTLILPMMAAGVLSQAIFYNLRSEGVFTHRLSQLGVKFGRGKDLNILEAIPVSKAMHTGVETIEADATLAHVRNVFEHTDHHGFPVVDSSGRICGMITTSDLIKHRLDDPTEKAIDIASTKVICLKDIDNCHQAIALLEDYHIGRIPVVDSQERPVGIVTRTDIVGAYKLALQLRQQELDEEGG